MKNSFGCNSISFAFINIRNGKSGWVFNKKLTIEFVSECTNFQAICNLLLCMLRQFNRRMDDVNAAGKHKQRN